MQLAGLQRYHIWNRNVRDPDRFTYFKVGKVMPFVGSGLQFAFVDMRFSHLQNLFPETIKVPSTLTTENYITVR